MSPFEKAVQQGVYLTLQRALLSPAVKKVYDYVPQPARPEDDALFPYVTVGADTSEPFDTDDSVGAIVECSVYVWSRYRGRAQVKQIQSEIYEALHRKEIEFAGLHLVGVEFVWSETALDPDGKTYSGTQRFTVTVEEK